MIRVKHPKVVQMNRRPCHESLKTGQQQTALDRCIGGKDCWAACNHGGSGAVRLSLTRALSSNLPGIPVLHRRGDEDHFAVFPKQWPHAERRKYLDEGRFASRHHFRSHGDTKAASLPATVGLTLLKSIGKCLDHVFRSPAGTAYIAQCRF